MPNSYLPFGNQKGWLLAIGEGRQKSSVKSSSASKQHSIWMHCLNAKVSSMAQSGMLGCKSQLGDINLMIVGYFSPYSGGKRY